MWVRLHKNWFAPNGTFYRTGSTPIEIPDEFAEVLPPRTEVLEDYQPETPPEEEAAPVTHRRRRS